MSEREVAIVTGAGSGIGRATAIRLGEAGYALALVGRTASKLRDTAGMLGGGSGLIIDEDVTGDDAPRRIVERTLAEFGRVDALVNAAGAAPLQPIEAITPALWRNCIDANLSAPVLLTAAVWPTFQRRRAGVIVNISSMASIDPFPGFSIYAAAKVGLNLFTKTTATEGAAIGVRAVAIAPGAVETPMLRGLFGADVIPPERTLTPEAVGEFVVACVTGARAFEPGEVIVLASP